MQWDLISRLSVASDKRGNIIFFIAPDILFAYFSAVQFVMIWLKNIPQVKFMFAIIRLLFYSKIHSWNELPQVFMKLKQHKIYVFGMRKVTIFCRCNGF
jgi:hypothetical protein